MAMAMAMAMEAAPAPVPLPLVLRFRNGEDRFALTDQPRQLPLGYAIDAPSIRSARTFGLLDEYARVHAQHARGGPGAVPDIAAWDRAFMEREVTDTDELHDLFMEYKIVDMSNLFVMVGGQGDGRGTCMLWLNVVSATQPYRIMFILQLAAIDNVGFHVLCFGRLVVVYNMLHIILVMADVPIEYFLAWNHACSQAASTLEMDGLSVLCAQKTADVVKKRTVEEVKALLGIADVGMTPEEELKLQHDNDAILCLR
uniref:SKP1 component dimerisation domain-containing protein n=1 Tax=Oryza sativa subsp. japonica TaxID=39947 RepID=Q2QMQ4_ORYSJ|nr:hypothetical protein LOC_Os12g40390 [Oryza sativa Japonica Group]